MKLGFSKKKLFKKRVKQKFNKICFFSNELIDRIYNIESNRNVEIFDTINELFTEFGILKL